MHLVNKKRNFVCLSFFCGSKWKKTFPFCFKKTTTSFFTFCSFLVSPKMKKTSFPFAWLWTKKKQQQLSLFVCSFFASPNDDNWWYVGRWYGIPNLVMTWWLKWVVVTKVSKCWWRHIEMVPKSKQFEILYCQICKNIVLLKIINVIKLILFILIKIYSFKLIIFSNFFFQTKRGRRPNGVRNWVDKKKCEQKKRYDDYDYH